MLTSTLQQKMGIPLETIIKNIESIENSQQLRLFENSCLDDPSILSFRNQIMSTKILAKRITYQLKDMQDWDAIKQDKLRAVS